MVFPAQEMTLPAQQAQIFLAMALCGAVLGAAGDGLRLLGKLLLRGSKIRPLGDVLYGLFCGCGVILAALYLRTDAFRWYTLLGAGVGMGLYAASLGRLWRAAERWMAGFVKKCS